MRYRLFSSNCWSADCRRIHTLCLPDPRPDATLHQGVPVDYRALLPHLLTPAIWAQKGSILGLVALLRAFLARDAAAMVEANQHTSVRGIVQQRLVLSKTNDGWGFELLENVVLHVPLCIPASFKLVCLTGGVELNVFVL